MTTQELAAAEEASVVAEFPVLAADIELCGQLQGSGFAAEQWLIQRDGRFLQVTGVLYRIAEAATGDHSVDDIAELVTATTGRAVSPAQVRHLIEQQLIPARIVAPAENAKDEAVAGVAAPSALAVNMRFGVVGPRRIEAVTRFLQYFYWPPVVIVILLAAAVGHIWLYFGHGVGASIQSALVAPGALLAALGIFIVSACFHELGHAAALRYAGGKVRGMGIGMYLLYPVFYTDVTDSYRLGRWARVRTDLGGFYFNVIFAGGLLALYAVTGLELLLLVVVMTNFDILRQSLPFVRMDGYWVLADLTGIPDLFTHLPAFVKSRNPFRCDAARTARFRLKGWVAAFFALYILVTVPLLLAALFFMVRGLPNVLAGAAASFEAFGRLFWAAVEAREFLIAAGTAAQIAILALTMGGFVYVLGRVAFDVGRALWRWGRPSAERRVVAAVVGTAMAALVASLWVPQGPWFGGTDQNLAARAAMPALIDMLADAEIGGDVVEQNSDLEAFVAGGRTSAMFAPETPTEPVKTHVLATPTAASELPAEATPAVDDVDSPQPTGVAAVKPAPVAIAKPPVSPPPSRSGIANAAGNVSPAAAATAAAEPYTTTVSGTPVAPDSATVAPTTVAPSTPTAPSQPPIVGTAAAVSTPVVAASTDVNLAEPKASVAAAAHVPSIEVDVGGTSLSGAGADPAATTATDDSDIEVDGAVEVTAETDASSVLEPVVDTAISAGGTIDQAVGGLLH